MHTYIYAYRYLYIDEWEAVLIFASFLFQVCANCKNKVIFKNRQKYILHFEKNGKLLHIDAHTYRNVI